MTHVNLLRLAKFADFATLCPFGVDGVVERLVGAEPHRVSTDVVRLSQAGRSSDWLSRRRRNILHTQFNLKKPGLIISI